jgi:hypothetical protein
VHPRWWQQHHRYLFVFYVSLYFILCGIPCNMCMWQLLSVPGVPRSPEVEAAKAAAKAAAVAAAKAAAVAAAKAAAAAAAKAAAVAAAFPAIPASPEVEAAKATAFAAAVAAAKVAQELRAAAFMEETTQKHFGYFAIRQWHVVECGKGGDCFFHTVLRLKLIYNVNADMYKTHGALRKQVVNHLRSNIADIKVNGQPASAILDPRGPAWFDKMLKPHEYVEYEVICGFAHMIEQTVVVYSAQCDRPLVIFPNGRTLGGRERVPETNFKLWTDGGHFQAITLNSN